jgi:hypothetical protein
VLLAVAACFDHATEFPKGKFGRLLNQNLCAGANFHTLFLDFSFGTRMLKVQLSLFDESGPSNHYFIRMVVAYQWPPLTRKKSAKRVENHFIPIYTERKGSSTSCRVRYRRSSAGISVVVSLFGEVS